VASALVVAAAGTLPAQLEVHTGLFSCSSCSLQLVRKMLAFQDSCFDIVVACTVAVAVAAYQIEGSCSKPVPALGIGFEIGRYCSAFVHTGCTVAVEELG